MDTQDTQNTQKSQHPSLQKEIRNIAILGNVETGKVTMLNTLMQLSPTSLPVPPEDQKGMYIMRCNQFLCQNKIIKATYVCSRGRLDFIDEISSILRVVDGAFIMVDALEGVSVLVEMALLKCMEERIEPIVILNKIENLLEYVKYDQEELYQVLNQIVKQVTDILKSCQGFQCSVKDNFLYASLKYGIIMNKKSFITILKNNQVMVDNLHKEIWFNAAGNGKDKQWTITNIIKPLCQLIKSYILYSQQKIKQASTDKTQTPSSETQIIKSLVSQWFNPLDILKKSIVHILPSPAQAQAYRAEVLYTGDITDPCGQGMLKCSQQAPLMMYVTNTINDPDNKQNIYRLARVFSGVLTKGQKIKILDRKYNFGSKSNIFYGTVKQIMQPVDGNSIFLEQAIAGSLICITGVDHKIIRAATITNFDLAHPITYLKSIQKRIAAFIRCEPEHYNQMIDQLKQLSKRRQGLRYRIEQTGEAFILGSSVYNVEAYIQDLKNELKFQITASQPFVRVKQTILSESQVVMSMSTNKQNKIFLKSQPLDQKLCKSIENKSIKFFGDKQARNQKLIKEFSWGEEDAMRIWSFGPQQKGPNILVDKTQNVKYLYEGKDPVIRGFNMATWHGALLDEPLRGVRVNLLDAVLAEQKQKRNPSAIIQATARAIYGCQLSSSPALMQPIFLCEIKIKGQQVMQIQEMIKLCRGQVIKINDLGYKKIIDAYIPAIEKKVFQHKFGESSYSMQYFQSIYHHDEVIKQFSLEEGTATYKLLMNMRRMKGLQEIVPNKNNYIDTL